jgi:aspartyl-tRNA(Asn)/glutamyl-tRNA(Gln) amidotransferase subunit C
LQQYPLTEKQARWKEERKHNVKITKDEVQYVAHLARLEFSAEEMEKFTLQLDNILSYIDKLNQADTTGVEPMTHAIPLANAFREDVAIPSLTSDASVANAPETRGSSFRVPKVIE